MTAFVQAAGRRLEVRDIPAAAPGRPAIVLLHEGLGALSLWRDFPEQIAARTGCRTIAYSRYGYGQSDVLQAPHGVDYMHREALESLPDLLAALDVERPVLLGHSDGASIALIHAGGAPRPVAGVVVMAPHVFVEPVSIASIEEARRVFETTDMKAKMGRHHADPERTFRGWNDIWLHPDFLAWNIEDCLPGITCPVLAIQGLADEYGTLAQLDRIEAGVAGPFERLELADCRHAPHRDQSQATLDAIAGFVRKLTAI